eukprot:TRINITY_DN4618_c0_g1_i1.p1 TRINITY_DN4618_c0_g1~~TRINITY_DN4618_c0_g1_i1.p1  ORF type:complete len:440 (-),score=104.32 TRINITY_DN4618_c0_g1_i1:52-1371(-)
MGCLFIASLLLLVVSSIADEATKGQGRKKRFIIEEMAAKHDVLRELLAERGWVEQTNKKNPIFDFKWTWAPDRVGKLGPKSTQIVNQFINVHEVSLKEALIGNLKKLAKQDSTIDLDSFFPRAYELTPQERPKFIDDFHATAQRSLRNADCLHSEALEDAQLDLNQNIGVATTSSRQSIDGDRNIWIVKPGTGARGIGIRLFDNLDTLFAYTDSQPSSYIVQKYVEKPMLIQNKKFDIRQFVLVTGLDPLTIFFFEDCYLRFTSTDYDLSNIADLFAHLTNHQIQKDSPTFHETDIPESQWSLPQFKQHLQELHPNSTDDIWLKRIRPRIEEIIITSLRSWPKKGHRDYSFQILGYDILLDEHLNPYLLEINGNPGLHMLTDIVRPHHRNFQDNMLQVLLDHRAIWSDPKNEQRNFGNLTLIYRDKDSFVGSWMKWLRS